MNKKIILGIDLGTTNSVASYWNGNSYILILNKDTYTFPSSIQFTKQGKKVSSIYNINTIRNFKRIVGKNTTDPETLKLIPDLNSTVKIIDNIVYFYNSYEDKYYTIEELNSLILKKIKYRADKQLNSNITDVIITIPAHFDQIQRESILTSAKLANLNCIRLINEPTAAAISYGMNYHDDVNILIFDLGGGTFDLSILNVDEGLFEVINTYGDNCLGGEDFTKAIMKDVINKFREQNKYYNLENVYLNKNLSLLREKCENLKCNLKKHNTFIIENFYNDLEKNIKINLEYSISKSEIETLFQPLLQKITSYLDKIIGLSNLDKSDIDYIILVGGSTKLQYIKFIVESYFQKKTISNINPDIVVSIGAAILGYTFSNPDTAFSSNIALVDILPLSIGIESDNGIMTKIINKGTKIPISKYKYFTTEEDNQSEVIIKIYQGERTLIKDNVEIGNFILRNIKLREKGGVIIKVEIHIDNNGVIDIKASEKGSNNNNSVIIKNNNLFYDNDKINELLKDAEKYEDIDNYKYKLCKKFTLIRNQIDNLKYNCYHNNHLNLENDELEILQKYITKLEEKIKVIIKPVEFMFYDNIPYKTIENNNYDNIINQIKKLIKINEKRYPGFIINYNNTDGDIKAYVKDNDNTLYNNQDIDNYNTTFKTYTTDIVSEINNDNRISKYSKNMIISYMNNLIYKLESISLDKDVYNKYCENFKDTIANIMSNDMVLLNKYGNIDTIRKIILKYNINIQITQEYNKIELFNLIYDISNQYDIDLDELPE